MKKKLTAMRLAALLLALPVPIAATSASAQDDFYKGKTLTIIMGTQLSGTIGPTAQLVSRHIGRYIPGNPTVILRQMPGAAHLISTGHVYNVADADGLTILAANPAVAMGQLAGVKNVRFDVRQFQWLGSTGPDVTVFSIRSTLPYKSFKELQNLENELVVGATGPGSNSYDFPRLLQDFAGARLRMVTGYATNNNIRLALERGEADGWAALSVGARRAVMAGTVRPLVRGRKQVKGFEDLPVDEDLATTPLGRSLMQIRSAPPAIGMPYAVRPGVPAERVALLREAFAKVLTDPQFLAEAKTAQLDMEFISAEQVTKEFNTLMGHSKETIEAMGKYIKLGSD
jgi:tripartite-type tricarboxylate transporter receptor subunit TctC